MRSLDPACACRLPLRVIVSHPTTRRSCSGGIDEGVGTPCRGRSAGLCAGGRARRHEGSGRSRQEGRRAYLVHRPLYVRRRRGAWRRVHQDVWHQGQCRAHHGAGRLPATAAGPQEQPDRLRRLLVDRRRSRRAAEGRREVRKVHSGDGLEDPAGIPELRPRRLLPHDVGRPGGDHLQHLQGEGRGGAQEVDRTCSTSSGRARSRPAIRDSRAMSAPGC